MAGLEGLLASRRYLLRRWPGADWEPQLQQALTRARQAVEADQFALAEERLSDLQPDLGRVLKDAAQEERYLRTEAHAYTAAS